MRFTSLSVLVLAAMLPATLAQTSTDCNPTLKSCPADVGLSSSSYTADFTTGSSANASWSAAAYTTINYGDQGAEFTIATAGQAPTIQTSFYFLFGKVDVKMKAAPGVGIVSSIVLESDDLDEIDWEFLGGNSAETETNFFGKGNTTAYDRAIYYPVSTPQETFHTYSLDWNCDRLLFIIDGVTVRTISYSDPLTNGGTNYPQTPMRLKLGNWAAGGPGVPTGTQQWAGGQTDFSKGPFSMYVETVSITNYNPADSYEYSDTSGSFQSIKIVQGGQSSSSNGTGSGTSATGIQSSAAAPTSSISVAGITGQTAAAVSTTISGSNYSMNTASASAQNSASANRTSLVSATTEVHGVSPTQASSSAAATASTTSQSASSGATAITAFGVGSLLVVALRFLTL